MIYLYVSSLKKVVLLVGVVLVVVGGGYLKWLSIWGFSLIPDWRKYYRDDFARSVVESAPVGVKAGFSLESRRVEVPIYDGMDLDSRDVENLTFSPDGTRVAFVYSGRKGAWVIADNQKYNLKSQVVEYFYFSPDSSLLMFTVRVLHKDRTNPVGTFLVVKSSSNKTFQRSASLNQGEEYYQVNGRQVPTGLFENFDSDYSLRGRVSPDKIDKRISVQRLYKQCDYMAGGEVRRIIVKDTSGNETFVSKKYCLLYREMYLMPDETTPVFIAATDASASKGYRVVIGNTEGPPLKKYARESMSFSPDGRYVGYGGLTDDGKISWIVEEVTRK